MVSKQGVHGMRVGVTGSTGLVGSALCASLISGGAEVVRIVRPGAPLEGGHILWDPVAGVIDAGNIEGLDALVHLAGANIGDRRWTTKQKQHIRDSRVLGTRLLSQTLANLAEPPKVFLSASAIGFYGPTGTDVAEESTPQGTDYLAEVCGAWEAETQVAAEVGIAVSLLRTGIVLSDEGGALAKMLPLFRRGLGGRFGSGSQYMSWITLTDQVRAIEWLLRQSDGGPFNLVAPNASTNTEFTEALAAQLGKSARLPVPKFGPRLLLGTELAQTLLFASVHVRPGRLLASGFEFENPTIESALRSILSGD